MNSKRHAFTLALLIALIVISYLVFSRPQYPQIFSHMDKLGHLGSFFWLSLLAYFAFKPKWYQLTVTLSIYAIFIELVQARLPYRSASVADFIADMAGIGLFYFCLWCYQRYFRATNVHDSP